MFKKLAFASCLLVLTMGSIANPFSSASALQEADDEMKTVPLSFSVKERPSPLHLDQVVYRGHIPDTDFSYEVELSVEQSSGEITEFSVRLGDKAFDLDVSKLHPMKKVDIGSLKFDTTVYDADEPKSLDIALDFHFGQMPPHCNAPYLGYDTRPYARFSLEYFGRITHWATIYDEDCEPVTERYRLDKY